MDSLIAGLHKFLTSPLLKAWLNEQLIHLKSYEARVRELKGVVENLKNVRDEIQHKVDEEELRRGREIPVEEKQWIKRVEELISEYVDFIKDPDHKLALFDLWESGYLPKPGIRYRQSRKAYDITRKANRLLQGANFDTFSYWSGPPSMAAFFSNVGYESFPSREETMRKIIAELEKPSVRMIGLHGLSGMGKTTLVKEVVKVALEAKKIDVVTMASVTRNPDIRKIQGQVADSLGIILDEESEVARAARIHKRLKNEKEKTLIILDDLWEKVDFNMLGIPYEIHNHTGLKNVKGKSVHVDSLMNQKEGSPKEARGASDELKTEKTRSQYKGCKVLLISESKTVLLTQMGWKENCVFSLEALKEKETEMLFKKMAGMGDYNSKFQKLGAQIANKCNGLPMTIVTTARALKKQSPFVWEDILRKLEWQKLTGAPELSTKLSYDLLEDDELKYTFLLCARMGHDALIMDLVKYCIGLGFLQGIYTVRETRDRVCTLVEKLKESGLLSDSYSRDQFTMQNIIRNAALSIANKEKHLFTLTKGKIDEWPEKLDEYAAISLHHCNFIEGFPRTIKYPGLRVFHVNNNDPHLIVPKIFFEGMQGLKVLILTGIHLSLLESSVSSLIELRMLCLEQCTLEESSIIGMLKKLRILSFSRSDIEKLPVELQNLKKLQILNLSNCSKLKEIPSGVISNLVCLEELYMRNTLIHWEKEELTRQSKIGLLSELKHLSQLTTLDIQIPEVSHLPKTLFFDKLYSYKIVIGDLSALLETDFKIPEMYETSRFLAIRLKDGFDIHSLKGVKMLFEGVQSLLLEELNTVHDLFYRLNLKGFPYLKHLLIVNNFTIQSLIYPKDRQQSQHPEKAFPKLESLHLYNLKKIKNICSCKLSEPSFGKLKVIKINLCGQLKSVFSISMVNLLTVLETIEVSECYSLTEIVSVEESQSNTQESKLVFPKLLYLKLQSLSLCGKFYPIPSSTEKKREKKLFNEKVDVSKLERMELSSIPITEIWNYHHSNRSSFKNLTHLDVNGCWKLEHLISFSMAKCLGSLQSLFVSECGKMKGIFPDSMQMEGGIFPKLKSIKLSSMKSLRKIWPSDLPSKSFSKLDTLIIEKCDKLVSVFPHYYEGIFHSLCNLTVTKCKLMRTIFDTYYDEMRDVGVVSLQDLHLEILPNLKHVWKLEKGKGGILELKNLQKIMVQNCYCLENIFPFSVAENLGNLEYLVVSYCVELREIVAKSAAANTAKLLFKFPKLRSIKFSVLPRLTSFYPGAFQLHCPTLNDLSIEYCDLLEPFHKETVDVQGKCVLFSEEVLNKLKSMQIESWHAKSQNSCMNEGNHRRDSLEELCLSRLLDTEILYSFLHSNPNLESLSLSNCLFEEIVPLEKNTKIETLGVVPKLKNLKLINCKLKDLGFEEDIILRRVELLLLKRCPCMTRVVSSSTSLSSLVNLEVDNCDGLENLMSPSTAESLGQLNTMKVTKCKNLMEIVGKDAGNVSKVVFKKLKTLELVSLKKLQSFCSSDSCEFEFPSLERLVVSACYNMKKFSDKVTSRSTPILQNVYVVPEKEKKRHCWEGDLNATIHKMFRDKKFFEGMNMMSFSDDQELKQDMVSFSHHPELNRAWVGGEFDPQSIHSWFYSLKVLKLEKCEIQQCAIPSNILPYLKNLNELMVQDCNNVEVVFEMNVTEGTGTTVQLQKLTLTRLPKLKNVWKRNGEGTHSFPNLQEVSVQKCHMMQTLFPAALLQNLLKLHKLIILSSWGLSEIVGKEDNAASGTQKFKFPCLTTLVLIDLPELIYLFPESFTLKCPVLNILSVLDCPQLDLFPHIDPKRVFSNLERLELEWKHSLVLESILQDLKDFFDDLNSICLRFDVDENEKPNLPIQILQRMPNLHKMSISSCHYLEAFRTEIPEINKKVMLTDLKLLELMDVWELKSIGSGDVPWLDTICKKLPRLYVSNCPHFMALMHSPSAEVFSCLKQLIVFNCPRLKYLFTSSAAEKLTQLECISLYKCRSIKEIVAKEQGETTSGEFKMQQLCRVFLSDLSSLECFYSGNRTLQLPSLIEVRIIECPKMEIFSQGSIGPNLCREIRTSYISNNGLVIVHDDLNSTLKKVFQQQNHIVFGDSRMLQEIWKSDTLPEGYFHNLTTMVVEGCGFLSDAILPSHLLHLLSNLKRLQVRRCNSLKAVFIHTKITNMGPQGSLTHLEELHVENCFELVAIVAKVEAEIDEANKEITIFSTITLLRLSHLPKLRCIYPEMHMLKWDMLKELHVEHCQKLKFFATEYQNSTYLNQDHQDRVSTAQQEVVSLEKVTPCLKVMSLGMEEAVMIEQGKLQIDLPKLSSLKLQCFDDEQGDAFPFIFGSKMSLSLPTIKKLGLFHCAFKEIFPTQAPGMDSTKILSQLKTLELVSLSQLKSIGLEHSWVMPLLQNLKTLLIRDCHCLTNLTPSTVSFSNLIKLNVKHCSKVKYLFTFSTTKTLVVLKEIYITNCKSLKTIVVEDRDGGHLIEDNEIEEEGEGDSNEDDDEEEEGQNESEYKEIDDDDDDDDDKDKEKMDEAKTNAEGGGDEGENDGGNDAKHGMEKEKEGDGAGEDDKNEAKANAKVEGDGDGNENENAGDGVNDGNECEDEITFKKLERLTLRSLPKLRSFYSGISALNFLSLEEVSFSKCCTAKLFCLDDKIPEKLRVKMDDCKRGMNFVKMQQMRQRHHDSC